MSSKLPSMVYYVCYTYIHLRSSVNIFYKLTFSGGSGNFPLQSQPNFRSQQTPYLSGPSPGKSGGGINLPP